MTEVQKARKWVRTAPGEVRALARHSHRSARQEARRALRSGDWDRALDVRPRSIARDIS